MKKYNNETWINKAKSIHRDYDYSMVNYINSQTKIIIICPKHGEFLQRPDMHINRGDGCIRCKSEKMVKSTDFFVEEVSKIYGSIYDFSKVEYKGCYEPIEIICKTHGYFIRKPNDLLKGMGCYSCNTHNLKLTTERFIEKAKLIHGDKYDYSKSVYIDSRQKIEIVCHTHGSFFPLANNHLHKNKYGCPSCDKSKGEIAIENFLKESNLKYKPQYTFVNLKYKKKLRFDFGIINDKKLLFLIEFNGKQHYIKDDFMHKTENDFLLRQLLDKMKQDYCIKNNIPLYIIRYDENITERLQEIKKIYEKENC